jgi:sulfide:quinone oxidoreductase
MPGVMRVLIAGAGVAALEALAGLRALAGDRVDATLLAPVDAFHYRPMSTAVPFTFREQRTRPLAGIASELGARFVHDGLVRVDAGRGRVLTRDGDFLHYDALLIAVGARLRRGSAPGATWSRSGQGVMDLARLLHELEDGTARSVAFVVPRGAAWPMDAYELAFVARLAAGRAGGGARVLVVTAEDSPVEALGPAASEAVGDELARAGIELVTGVDEPGSSPAVERVVRLPEAHGPAIAGVTHDARGFMRVDAHARTAHDPRVYAAGDATALLLKHSTLASSQATAAAEAIAAEAGADITPTPWSAVLYGMLTLPPRYPGAPGSPWLADGEPTTNCVWWPPGHVAGRHLAPYLAAGDRGVRPGLERHPAGLPVAAPVGGDAAAGDDGPAGASSEEDLRHDALTRQLLALRRAEREGEDLGHDLKRRLDEVERHGQEVIGKLEAAGYLRHAD